MTGIRRVHVRGVHVAPVGVVRVDRQRHVRHESQVRIRVRIAPPLQQLAHASERRRQHHFERAVPFTAQRDSPLHLVDEPGESPRVEGHPAAEDQQLRRSGGPPATFAQNGEEYAFTAVPVIEDLAHPVGCPEHSEPAIRVVPCAPRDARGQTAPSTPALALRSASRVAPFHLSMAFRRLTTGNRHGAGELSYMPRLAHRIARPAHLIARPAHAITKLAHSIAKLAFALVDVARPLPSLALRVAVLTLRIASPALRLAWLALRFASHAVSSARPARRIAWLPPRIAWQAPSGVNAAVRAARRPR